MATEGMTWGIMAHGVDEGALVKGVMKGSRYEGDVPGKPSRACPEEGMVLGDVLSCCCRLT